MGNDNNSPDLQNKLNYFHVRGPNKTISNKFNRGKLIPGSLAENWEEELALMYNCISIRLFFHVVFIDLYSFRWFSEFNVGKLEVILCVGIIKRRNLIFVLNLR